MNKEIFWKSVKEVSWLLIISILPNVVAIVILAISTENFLSVLRANIIPGELVAYSLSFIAPFLYLIIKTHGEGYKLPFLGTISIITLVVYCITLGLCVTARNHWSEVINMEPQLGNLYFYWALIFLFVSLVIWVYSTYHNEGFGDYGAKMKAAQNAFNNTFKASVNPHTTNNPGTTP